MKPGTLLISLKDYNDTASLGAVFNPFVPKKDTICTLESIQSGALIMEEVKILVNGREWGFYPRDWKELDVPSIEEVTEFVKECELVRIHPQEWI